MKSNYTDSRRVPLVRLPTSKKIYSAIMPVYVLFLVHMTVNLERYILFNELMVCVSLVLCVAMARIYFALKVDRSYLLVLMFLGYGFFRVMISLVFLETGLYNLIRTMPVVYSIPCFFLGILFYDITAELVERHKLGRMVTVVVSSFVGWRLATPSLWALLLLSGAKPRYLALFLSWCCLLVVTITYSHDGLTTYLLMGIIFLSLPVLGRKFCLRAIYMAANPWILIPAVFLVIGLLNIAHHEFKGFYTLGYAYFGDDSDVNAIWRLMLWAMTINHAVTENIWLGIGFGTPIFDGADSGTKFITFTSPDDPILPYTLGLHNSFLYIFVRMGAVGLFLFLFCLSSLVRAAVPVAKQNNLAFGVLISVLIMVMAAMFNVVLESSLYSGSFWVLFGMLFKSLWVNEVRIS